MAPTAQKKTDLAVRFSCIKKEIPGQAGDDSGLLLATVVIVFDADDVVFAGVLAHLDFNDD